jgi:hypothetical protein
MIFRVGIENNNEGFRSIAWALEHPGCFAYGKDQKEAVANLPAAIHAYADWITQRESSRLDVTEIELEVEDIWTAYFIDEAFERVENSDNEISAWFQYDWKPLTAEDIQHGLKLLGWARRDLLQTLHPLTEAQWAYKAVGERWDIAGIVKHVAVADWWYVDRLGLAYPRKELPDEPLERLEKSRSLMCTTLQMLEGVDKVMGTEGEFWSPRKMLRRAVWHERDHTEHIRKLLSIQPTK